MLSGRRSTPPSYCEMFKARNLKKEKTPIEGETPKISTPPTPRPCTSTNAHSDDAKVTFSRRMPSGEVVEITANYDAAVAYMQNLQ
jgi:hypothetical protein